MLLRRMNAEAIIVKRLGRGVVGRIDVIRGRDTRRDHVGQRFKTSPRRSRENAGRSSISRVKLGVEKRVLPCAQDDTPGLGSFARVKQVLCIEKDDDTSMLNDGDEGRAANYCCRTTCWPSFRPLITSVTEPLERPTLMGILRLPSFWLLSGISTDAFFWPS